MYNLRIVKRRNYNTKYCSIKRDYLNNTSNHDGPLPLPGNHENEIIEAILLEDPSFNKDEILNYTKYIFCLLQKTLTEGSLSSIRHYLQDEFYENQQKQLTSFLEYGYTVISEVIQIQRIYLHLYQRDEGEEILTFFVTADMRQYTIDNTDQEIVDGDEDDVLHFHYFINLTRVSGAKTTVGSEYTKICPTCCSTHGLKENYENNHLLDRYSGWVLNSLTRIYDFSKIDERGVVFY